MSIPILLFSLVSARFAETENLKKRLSKTFSLDELNPAEITKYCYSINECTCRSNLDRSLLLASSHLPPSLMRIFQL